MPVIYLQQYQTFARSFEVDLDESIDSSTASVSSDYVYPSSTVDLDESVDASNSNRSVSYTYPSYSADLDESIGGDHNATSVTQTYPSLTADVDESIDANNGSSSISYAYPSTSADLDESIEPSLSSVSVTQTFPSASADLDESIEVDNGSSSVSRTYPTATADLDESIDSLSSNGSISGDVEAEVEEGTVSNWATLINGTAHQIRLYEAGAGGAEISGGGYSRGSSTFSGQVSVYAENDSGVTFSPTADWGPVVIKAYTSGGTLLATWSNEYDIGPNRTFTIPASTIRIT